MFLMQYVRIKINTHADSYISTMSGCLTHPIRVESIDHHRNDAEEIRGLLACQHDSNMNESSINFGYNSTTHRRQRVCRVPRVSQRRDHRGEPVRDGGHNIRLLSID